MDVKIYVGNLSYSTTEDDLRALFETTGTIVSIALMKDRDTGQSKGFAFIEMSSQVEAQAAIKKYNGYSLGNRELKVNIARPREERPRGGGYGDRGGYGNKSGHSRPTGGKTRRY